ncbi:MAG TPA: hypothetical protein VFN08_11940 [Gemmatimonadales bacterium]|jgi:hypothetical protein|nr:hypothetical protein [Gemmatimonadales bacterium]
MAALYVSSAASRDALHQQPGTVARLGRIYRQSGDPQVRAAVVSGLASSADDGGSLAFLEGVATKGTQDFPGASKAALAAMTSHGEKGRDVLRRIHTAKTVHDPEARQWLDLVATKDYRVR